MFGTFAGAVASAGRLGEVETPVAFCVSDVVDVFMDLRDKWSEFESRGGVLRGPRSLNDAPKFAGFLKDTAAFDYRKAALRA